MSNMRREVQGLPKRTWADVVIHLFAIWGIAALAVNLAVTCN